VYQQAVYWFAASFSLLALDTLLLALLAAQQYRRTGHPLHLGLCALGCALSPCWFGSGILAGPLCCLYLLWPEQAAGGNRPATAGARLRFALLRSTPLLGSALFLAVSLPLTARTIMHLEHYEKIFHTNAVGAFRPGTGLLLTCKSLVENLLLGAVGVSGVSFGPWVEVCLLVSMAAAAAWWWWQAPDRRLLLLGLGMIFGGYLLVYSARALWFIDENGGFAPINEPRWSRYHVLPQLGLALYVCGGLPAFNRGLFALRPDGGLTWRQACAMTCLIYLCFAVQFPRAIIGANAAYDLTQMKEFTDQMDTLRWIEKVDRCCREQRIGADAARRVLPDLDIPWSLHSVNGWVFLRGSPEPVERSDEEVKKILWNCD
jgi:hypothetical protein